MESLVQTGPQPLANNGPRKSSVPYRVQVSASHRVSPDPLDRVLVDACDIPNPFVAHGRGASAKHFSNDRRFRWMDRRLIRFDGLLPNPNGQLTGPSETCDYVIGILLASSEGQQGAVSWTSFAWRVRGVKGVWFPYWSCRHTDRFA